MCCRRRRRLCRQCKRTCLQLIALVGASVSVLIVIAFFRLPSSRARSKLAREDIKKSKPLPREVFFSTIESSKMLSTGQNARSDLSANASLKYDLSLRPAYSPKIDCMCDKASCKVPALGRPLRVCFEHDESLAYKWNGLLKTSVASNAQMGGASILTSVCVNLLDTKKSCSKLGSKALPIDVILTEHTSITHLLQLLDPSGDLQQMTGGAWVVLAERADPCTLRHRRLLKYSRLAAYMKEYVPRNRSDLNIRHLGQKGRMHYGMLCSEVQWQNANCIDEETLPPPTNTFSAPELGKVVPASWNWGQYHIYLDGSLRNVLSDSYRLFQHPKDECDLFLATHKRDSLEGHFRQLALQTALNLSRTPMPHRPRGPRLCIHTKKLSFQEYSRLLSRSVAVVCPWGLGERTACDEHAALVGALLLKPKTDFVEAVPDFYKDGYTYLALQLNYSDLGTQLARALQDKDGEITAIRKRAYKIIRQSTGTTLATDFWEKLRRQVGKSTGYTFRKPTSKDDHDNVRKRFSPSMACENAVALRKWNMCS